ncbi:gentisate 1,2-dioxygenase [Undibacterium sp. Ji50W]|uniref:gentisate 1,2-dioxygenase n=1 Tax=Undibacterium sp. Ji50W TaxID=3413041 RepID=UPI003BF12E71
MNKELANDVHEERQRYYQHINEYSMTPLWEVLGRLVPKEPAPVVAAALWKYSEVRDQVLRAGTLITAEEAERRVLILENPALRGNSSITQSLYAGLQLIMPGEVAPAHRHTQSALRLVLDGEGAYTAVDGERSTMRRGDFIITPSWTWHDHGNLGNDPVIWLDGLDIPLVRFFDAGFSEHSEERSQQVSRQEGDALARYGSNMLPVDFYQVSNQATKVFAYPFVQTRLSLLTVSQGEIDRHHGHKLRFVNPATGASPMPTIAAFAQYLPRNFESYPYRCTDATVYVCLEGEGTATIDNKLFHFSQNDVFVVPSWHRLSLRAASNCILFSYSDRPVQQAMGLWREERIQNN